MRKLRAQQRTTRLRPNGTIRVKCYDGCGATLTYTIADAPLALFWRPHKIITHFRKLQLDEDRDVLAMCEECHARSAYAYLPITVDFDLDRTPDSVRAEWESQKRDMLPPVDLEP